jgi:predicted Ser/Thr protein kinase
MEDLTGKQLGSYQVVEPLGEGGMAAVYKAYQPGMERYVALKILPRHFASDPEFVGRFEQEAKVLAKLQHPHILPVFDFGEADGYTYIVMPFLESGDLTDLLQGQPLSLPQIRRLISQLGDALDYAHQRGLIHRDVKPSNVLLDERGNCLLMDFGITKIVEGTAKFTATGGFIGTPAYMSPEQGLGRKLDGRSDIYALGIMLYEMVTGRVPYRAETPMAVVVKHINDPLPPPHQVNPDLPEAIERIILKALAKQPEDRYPTAGDMVRALQTAIPDTIVDETLPADERATMISPVGPTREARIQEVVETAVDRKPSFLSLAWMLAIVVVVAIVIIGAIVFFVFGGGGRGVDTEATVAAAVAATEQAEAEAAQTAEELTEEPEPTVTPGPPADTASPKPTYTPRPTIGPTATIDADSTVYDNFNNPAFEGSYDQDRWRKSDYIAGDLIQRDGVLVAAQEGEPDTETTLVPREYDNIQLNTPFFFEARLMLDPEQNSGAVYIAIGAGLSGDVWWNSDCSFDSKSGQSTVWAKCVDYPWPEQAGHRYESDGKTLDTGTWYPVRIEVDPATMTFTYYLDGQMVGSHVPVDAEKFKQAKFSFKLGVWGVSSEAITGYIDDVRIGPLDEQSIVSQPTPMPTSTPTETPLPTQPTPTPTPSIWKDDFEGTLDPGWSWLNEDPTHWSLTDVPGSLRIITQGESLYNTGKPSNLLLRDAPQGNFQIVAKVTLNPTDNFQQAAVLIYQDEDNFVLLNRGFCGEEGCVGSGVYLDREINGEVDFGGPRASLSLQTILLGLRKEGTRYIGYYSTDGENWTALGALEHPMTPTKVGLTANNANSDPGVPQIPADFDFFAIREF